MKKNKVIVLGLQKTGTTTLETVLNQFGYRVYGGDKNLLKFNKRDEVLNYIEEIFEKIGEEFGGQFDFIVHAIAGGPSKEDLKGKYMDTDRSSFLRSMEISVYSYVKALQLAYPFMKEEGGAAVTLTYYGGEKVIPNYNVMGVAKAALESSVQYLAADLGQDNIRVNALSPGPILTRAASGISDFRGLMKNFKEKSPMGRLVEQEEVAASALYLLSDLSSMVTGEIVHVDGGFHVQG
jgi:enoyl-[acyl-carrier protein] reductase I